MGSLGLVFSVPSGSTITVKVIDTTTISNIPLSAIVGPPVPGVSLFPPAPSLCFLLEHSSGGKVLFDLATRKDVHNLGPTVLERLAEAGYEVKVEKNVIDVLEENGIRGEDIQAVIWSHWHWDHTGDPSTFPPTTDLVVGPGFKKTFLAVESRQSDSQLGQIQESAYTGRSLREIEFKGPNALRIGEFPAYDFFGDGSFYLLDSPGHAIGHLCGLARTTTNPETFVFMGGDAAHHCGEFRPSQHVPMPTSITPDPMASIRPSKGPFCPGHLFEELQEQRGMDPQGPLFIPNMGDDIPQVIRTMEKMQAADGEENIFIIIAHDYVVRDLVDHFPKSINDWQERGWARHSKWGFLKDVEPALRTKVAAQGMDMA